MKENNKNNDDINLRTVGLLNNHRSFHITHQSHNPKGAYTSSKANFSLTKPKSPTWSICWAGGFRTNPTSTPS